MRTTKPIVLYIGESSRGTAQLCADAVDGHVVAATKAELGVAEEVRRLFAAGQTVIGVCASGILIRAVAPLLRNKYEEPPVIAVAEDGTAVVPLLGGHRGANRLAERLAARLGSRVALTTASEVRLGLALDMPPAGWRIENVDAVKAAASALMAGRPATISGQLDWLGKLAGFHNVTAKDESEDAPFACLSVDDVPPVIYRHARYAVGVGCSRHCSAEELLLLVQSSLQEAGLVPGNIAAVFSIDIKCDETAIHDLARELGVEARFFDAETLRAEENRLPNPSNVVRNSVGVSGVCEAAALAAAGAGGALVVEKRISASATCAVSRIASPVAGLRRGYLAIIGIGPGHTEWRTLEASELLAQADEIVGYQGYLNLLGSEALGKTLVSFRLGEETKRCTYALETAADGKVVALVCSGDAGIYAMGSLVYELIAEGRVSEAAQRVEIQCVPGLTAMQAAAARVGAPLGHDFCAISLSDLLTPRDVILRRLQAAADGDFVTALYNPVSRQRQSLLGEARKIMLGQRPSATPVILARNLGRDGEKISLLELSELDASKLDMLTIVIIGSTTTQSFKTGSGKFCVYTPRGYSGTT